MSTYSIRTRTRHGRLAAAGLFLGLCVGTGATQAEDNVLLVLDGSGSMWGKAGDEIKIEAARRVLNDLLTTLPPEVNVGLLAYGHRRKGDCADIELLSAPGERPRSTVGEQLDTLQPKGKTPIAGALESAGELLRESESATTVVLVSDGVESCGGDPCAMAATLADSGIDLSIHVVGYDVDETAGEQLACIAERGRGQYFSAENSAGLGEALSRVEAAIVERVPETEEPDESGTRAMLAPDVIGGVNLVDAASGEKHVRLSGQREFDVEPGRYRLEFDHFESEPVTIEANTTREISAAEFGLASVARDEQTVGGITLIDADSGEKIVYLGNSAPKQIPAGRYRLEFANFTSEPVTIEPGSTQVFSANDYALASVARDEQTIGGITLIDADSGEKIVYLGNNAPKQVPAGRYRLQFTNFTSEPLTIEPGSTQVFSANDYRLASVARDPETVGGLSVIDADSGERVVYLGNASPQQIPAGRYRLEFSNFTSEPLTIEPGSTQVFSATDYALASVARDEETIGSLRLIDADSGEQVLFLGNSSRQQIPAGRYRLKFEYFTSEPVTIEPGSTQVFSANDYELATVVRDESVDGLLKLLDATSGQTIVRLGNNSRAQIPAGRYRMELSDQPIGEIDIRPGETRLLQGD